MSYQLMAWASEQTTGSPTRKAVLLALANAANHHTGECWPSVERICSETEFGKTAVKDALTGLVDAGLIVRERRRRLDGSLGTYNYRFPHVRRAPDLEPGDGLLEPGGGPGLEPGGGSLNQEVLNQEALPPNGGNAEQPRTVDRRRVTDEERAFAVDVLNGWNGLTGQRLSAPEWKAKIILRHREHPDATVDDHLALIERTLTDPWWKGPATPSVIYGSAAQFERTIEAARAGATSGAAAAARIAQEAIDERRRS